jgi:hypothetical protein
MFAKHSSSPLRRFGSAFFLPSSVNEVSRRRRKPDALSRAILSNLSQLADALEHGSIVTFEPSRIRVRALPINSTSVD